jgi:chorismate mutase
MAVRGLRGATTVEKNESAEILQATRELLQELLSANGITTYEDVVSAIFTTTTDVNAVFPAEAARAIGMSQVPLLCASEIAVPGAMPRCIRILLHVNTEQPQSAMKHVYLREAKRLRPDMVSAQ